MMKKYQIEKDKILKEWIVFERHGSLLIEVFKSKLKRDCTRWVNENEEERNKSK